MYLTGISKLWDFSFLLNKEVVLGFVSGLGTTLAIAILGVAVGIIIGILLAVGKLVGNKFVKAICTIYINWFRGTPLLLQLYMLFYVTDFLTHELLGITIFGTHTFVVAFVAIGLNSAAYVAEIFRAGILSIDKGQFEAARSLGLNYPKTLKLIILPQAIRNILPALGNEYISVIKETAIVSTIGANDLMFYGNQMRNLMYNPFPPLFLVGITYFVVVYFLTKLVTLWERKLKND